MPAPATDYNSMVPPMRSILVRTTSMPTPRPETLVTFSAVEKPGAKMNSQNLRFAHLVDVGFRGQAAW